MAVSTKAPTREQLIEKWVEQDNADWYRQCSRDLLRTASRELAPRKGGEQS